jgi:hypothetical protein
MKGLKISSNTFSSGWSHCHTAAESVVKPSPADPQVPPSVLPELVPELLHLHSCHPQRTWAGTSSCIRGAWTCKVAGSAATVQQHPAIHMLLSAQFSKSVVDGGDGAWLAGCWAGVINCRPLGLARSDSGSRQVLFNILSEEHYLATTRQGHWILSNCCPTGGFHDGSALPTCDGVWWGASSRGTSYTSLNTLTLCLALTA